MPVHISAEEGYANVGATYEKGRPEYPADAVVYLLQRLGHPRAVVDLAAGTGKFTRALLRAGVAPIAVEPVAHMRDTLAAQQLGIDILDGTAESLPLDDGSVDAVIAAQAFHWFDATAALREIRRVLRPGGALGLLWNRGPDVEWARPIWEEMGKLRGDTPSAWTFEWREAFRSDAGFGPLQNAMFRHDVRADRDALIARVTSISFVAAGDQSVRDRLVAYTHRVCDDNALPEQFVLPYNTYVYWCRKS